MITLPEDCNQLTKYAGTQQKTVKLLKYLSMIYPSSKSFSFRTAEDTRLAVSLWSFAEALPDDKLRIGCQRCKLEEPYPPVPARFRFLAYGLIDTDKAYQYAMNKNWVNGVIYWASRDARMHDRVSRHNEEQAERLFRRCYALRCDEVLEGKFFTVPEMVDANATMEWYKDMNFKKFRYIINRDHGDRFDNIMTREWGEYAAARNNDTYKQYKDDKFRIFKEFFAAKHR